MSSETFGDSYAAAYDSLYADKNYRVECDLIETSFQRYSSAGVESILDLGCGTGTHARLLARDGYRITAVDRSAKMLEIAREKPIEQPHAIRWVQADLRSMNLNDTFDAAILMFAVLGYFNTDHDVIEALTNIRRHLRPAGLLCFDFWYGPAVLSIGPSDRVRTVSVRGGHLTRRVSATLFPEEHRCHVRYELQHHKPDRDKQVASQETHIIRFFFPDEIRTSLDTAGFTLLSLSAFPSIDQPLDNSTWSAFCVARTV